MKVPLLVATDQPPPLPKWTRWIRFEQVAPEENRLREYGITISQNLLGEWVVSSSWGRIGGRQQVKAAYFASKSEAMALAERDAIRRLLRGYQVSAFESSTTIRELKSLKQWFLTPRLGNPLLNVEGC